MGLAKVKACKKELDTGNRVGRGGKRCSQAQTASRVGMVATRFKSSAVDLSETLLTMAANSIFIFL